MREPTHGTAFHPGDRVRVRASDHAGHHRTPRYLKGRQGVVEQHLEDAPNPETLAYGKDGLPRVPAYIVRFAQSELWPAYPGPATDTLVAAVLEHWLQPAS